MILEYSDISACVCANLIYSATVYMLSLCSCEFAPALVTARPVAIRPCPWAAKKIFVFQNHISELRSRMGLCFRIGMNQQKCVASF